MVRNIRASVMAGGGFALASADAVPTLRRSVSTFINFLLF
jgi:hypothetical protein